jgi:hypothetical protein
MQARIVSAGQGARWLSSGWRLFRAAPVGWLAATFAYWFAMSVVSLVPVVGGIVALIVVPAFTVGFMALGRASEGGAPIGLGLLFEGFRHRVGAQIVLGLLYLASFAAVLGASALADGGALARWMMGAGEEPADSLAAAAFAAAAYVPVMAAFWFAPPLAAWHSLGAGKALFFSFFAFLLNWRALLAYGALAAAFALPLALVLKLAAPLFLPLMLLVVPVLLASFYASYHDVFGYHPGQ